MNPLSALRAIVWKELRFNWRWAAIGSIGLLLDLLYQAQSGINNSDLGALWTSTHSTLVVATLLIAIALGVLQIAPEQSRDRWAFLLHRPIRPSLLLFGKVLTGICLYLLTTLVPFLGLSLWVATPGHVAGPFDIRAMLNGAMDILVGVPFYLAAMLCLVRKGKWYGTRFLPLCAALIVPVLMECCTDWWQVVLLVFLFTGLFGFCLWGAFGVPDGAQRRLTGRFAIGSVLVLAVTLLQSWVISLLFGIPFSHWPKTGSYGPSYWYAVLKSGDAVREEYLDDVFVGAVGVGSSASSKNMEAYSSGSDKIQYLESSRPLIQGFRLPFYLKSSYVPRLGGEADGYGPIWYLFRGHLLEYDPGTRRLQGELTAEGFKAESTLSGTGKFTLDSNMSNILMADGRLYFRNGDGSIVEILDTAKTGEVSGLRYATSGTMFAVTKKAIYWISKSGQVKLSLPRLYPSLRLGMAPDPSGIESKDRLFVEYDTQAGADDNPFTPSLLLEYSSSGALLRSQVLPPLPVSEGTVRHPLMALLVGFLCPALLRAAVVPASHLLTRGSLLGFSSVDSLSEFSRSDSDFILFWCAALTASLLSVLISVFISHRRGGTRKSCALWALGAFLLSFPAIVVQLSGTEVPLGKARKPAENGASTVAPDGLGERRLLPEDRKINRAGAIFWKEIKSSWRWAALGAFGLLIGAFGEIYIGTGSPQELYKVWGSVQTTMLMGGAIFGLGLSILQIYPEQSRDRWAFLVHRPATRDLLFVGKAAAGLLLYGIASSCSLLLVTAWIACPGRFAFPFVWGLTLGSWMGVFCGCIFYFAGFLVMLRPARWFGSRLFPVVGAGAWTALILIMPTFWESAVACVVFAAIMAYSARSQFRIPAGGRVTGSGVISLGAILLTGIVVVVVFGFSVSASLYFMAVPNAVSGEAGYNYFIDSSGSIIQGKYVRGVEQSRIIIKAGTAKLPDNQDALTLNLGDLWSPKVGGNDQQNYTNLEDYIEELSGDTRGNVRWYLVNRRVLAFSLADSSVQGVLTPNGYVAGRVRNIPSETFPILSNSSLSMNYFPVLAGRDSLYFLDLADKAVYSAVVGSASAAQIVEISSTGSLDDDLEYSPRVIVLSGDSLDIFSDRGALLGTLSVKEYRTYSCARIGMDAAGHLYLWLSSQGSSLESTKTQGDVIVETDPSGHTVGITQLPPLPGSGSRLSQSSSPPVYNTTGSRVAMGCVMAPLITPRLLALVFQVPVYVVNDGYTEAFGHHRKDVRSGQILASLLCGMLGWFIARRARLSVVASVAGGLVCATLLWIGVLLLIALFAWPTRMRCPSCGRKRFVEESNCRHCHEGWSPPVRTGTEIFENLNETLHGSDGISQEHLGTMR